MYFKKSLSVVATMFVASTILFTSCKKNDDVSSATGLPGNQTATGIAPGIAVQGASSNVATAVNADNQTASYTVTSNDGHTIGINGVKPAGNPKTGLNMIQSCGAASNLFVVAQSNSGGCLLANAWIPGAGSCLALYINGLQYHDPNTGYSLFSPAVNGINASSSQIEGGINASEVFNVFVRNYCNTDTTGSSYFDSPITTYQVADNFVCGGGNGGGGTSTTVTHGHRR